MPSLPSKPVGLVGRDEECQAIESAIDAACNGHGGTVFLTGEPGIGKSTLAHHAAAAARSKSLIVFWGFTWEAGGAPAYWPWTQLIRSMVDVLSPSPGELRGLEQLLLDQDSDKVDGLPPQHARFLLLESVRRFLDITTRETPLVIIFEDLHAADSDSLQLLQHIAQHASSMSLLCIGTFRVIEAHQSDQTDALFRTTRDALCLALPRFSEEDIGEYALKRGFAEQLSPGELLNTTAGNPLFVSELVETLSRPTKGGPRPQLPVSLQQLIRNQIQLLPEATAELLSMASIAGREFSTESLTHLAHRSWSSIAADLTAAKDCSFLIDADNGNLRFFHALHRDVLYQDLSLDTRTQLHREFADYLVSAIEMGAEGRETELALHLTAAGAAYRNEAVAAWRRSAKIASRRSAYDDAINALRKARKVQDEDAATPPSEKFDLLLELANAHFVVGDTTALRRHCDDAFKIAKAAGNAQMMSKAALTRGSAIIVANIDRGLVDALSAALTALPEDDKATRARVQARLAGALQPAKDPAIPMQMAYEAIDMARQTDDECVLHDVLRSAISALMDFAPAAERIALNKEHSQLARRCGDLPGRFRSHLRLMIDASEAGDRAMMDEAIAEIDQQASEFNLPHYLWRARSVRAMQATINGDFSRARDLLQEAQRLVEPLRDGEASLTLALQRLVLLVEWQSDDPTVLTDIQANVTNAYANGMQSAQFYVDPFLASCVGETTPAQAKEFLSNERVVERTFAGGDRFSLSRTARLALSANRPAIAERAIAALLPNETDCITLGLMGTSWCGPVALELGELALGLNRNDDAIAFFDTALRVASRMNARPFIARVHHGLARAYRKTGDTAQANDHERRYKDIARKIDLRLEQHVPAMQTTPQPGNTATSVPALEATANGYTVRLGSEETTLRNSRGLSMLHTLLARPDQDIHCLELSGSTEVVDSAGHGDLLDDKARKEYQQRVRVLREELDDADTLGDIGRAEAAREELEFIRLELSRAFGLGGKARPAGKAAERARVNVRRRLKDAIDRIGEAIPAAGRFYENTIKTGTYCRYSPM